MAIRVLILSGRRPDFQTDRAVDALARGLGEGFDARVVRIGRSVRHGADAARAVRRAGSDVDVIHAFGTDALTVAAMASRARVAFTPVGFPSPRAAGWVRAVGAYRDVQVVCPTTTHARAFAAGGVPAERCHVVRPGVDFARARRRRDDALRARLGLRPADVVILAVGESTAAAAHHKAVWAADILRAVEPATRLLLWGRGDRARAVSRFARQMNAPGTAVVASRALGDDVPFESLLSAADMALVTAVAPVPTLPIATAMAAGLPLVATVTYTVAELLEDRHTALMVTRPTPREIARRVQDLWADERLRWRLADAARTEAYAYFATTRFLDQHRAAYRQLAAGQPVAPPDEPVGAGMQFGARD